MDVKLYTGNGGTQSITGLAFSPDFVWTKARSFAENNNAFDTVRGATNLLLIDQTNSEQTISGITAFNSDGYTIGSHISCNSNGQTYVSWNWDAGTSTVSNTQGSITSQVRANPSAGFSVVTYTGNLSGNGNVTVGHGLGVAPQLIITKARSGSSRWAVQMPTALSANNYLELNSTSAQASWGAQTRANPTSTVFDTIYAGGVNENGVTYVAYCWTPVVGYSSFGSYTGNGSADGPFVFCGFRPKWVLFKCSSTTSAWNLTDTTRQTYNVQQTWLQPNTSDAEYTGGSSEMDILSNGFKLRNSNSPFNTSSATYIYAAFAEAPFNYSRAR
jgi:hypothetical protein